MAALGSVQVNLELARVVTAAGGWPVDTRTADDPHTKADLLFQVCSGSRAPESAPPGAAPNSSVGAEIFASHLLTQFPPSHSIPGLIRWGSATSCAFRCR